MVDGVTVLSFILLKTIVSLDELALSLHNDDDDVLHSLALLPEVDLVLQVLAIEFVPLAIEFVPLANEFVTLAIEFVALAFEFVALARKFVRNKIGSWSEHENKM